MRPARWNEEAHLKASLAAAAAVLAFTVPQAALARRGLPTESARNETVIRAVFGSAYGSQAVAVARCESGLSVWATNGQYLGSFQEGEYARARFGFGWDIWAQARSAFAYFKASGYRWTAWTCRPY